MNISTIIQVLSLAIAWFWFERQYFKKSLQDQRKKDIEESEIVKERIRVVEDLNLLLNILYPKN